jgi:hypothetical protein
VNVAINSDCLGVDVAIFSVFDEDATDGGEHLMREIVVTLTDPVEGEDDEYNSWYSDTHLGEVLAIDGFVAAQRFRVVDGTSPGAPHRYLAIYEIEDGELESAQDRLQAALMGGKLKTSSAISPVSDLWLLSAITERVVASE